jgi:hypothetical protein
MNSQDPTAKRFRSTHIYTANPIRINSAVIQRPPRLPLPNLPSPHHTPSPPRRAIPLYNHGEAAAPPCCIIPACVRPTARTEESRRSVRRREADYREAVSSSSVRSSRCAAARIQGASRCARQVPRARRARESRHSRFRRPMRPQSPDCRHSGSRGTPQQSGIGKPDSPRSRSRAPISRPLQHRGVAEIRETTSRHHLPEPSARQPFRGPRLAA